VKYRGVKTFLQKTQEANVKRIIDKNFWVEKKTRKQKLFESFSKMVTLRRSERKVIASEFLDTCLDYLFHRMYIRICNLKKKIKNKWGLK